MPLINKKKKFCYRITHIRNLQHIINNGLCTKHHPSANSDFITIGNPEIIDTRDTTPVRIKEYGFIGDYVPFYFTPRSIMLFNILTGYYHPIVPRRGKEEIIVIRCLINRLAKTERFFFTDGQANAAITSHFHDLRNLDKIDWDCICHSNFAKSEDDFDRPRRYQAEFLVYHELPFTKVESICVYSPEVAKAVEESLEEAGISDLPVFVQPNYYF